MFTIALDPKTQRRYPLDIVRARQTFPDTLNMIRAQYAKWNHQLIHVESNAFQAAVLQELGQQDRAIPVKGYRTGPEKLDPAVGVPSMAATLANGAWLIPTGGPSHPRRCDCGWCAWRRELALHPGGEHSDTIMGMWFSDLAAREGIKKWKAVRQADAFLRLNQGLRRRSYLNQPPFGERAKRWRGRLWDDDYVDEEC